MLLAGGTRVLKREHQVTSLVDLAGLGLTFLRIGFGYLFEPFNDNTNPRAI